MTAKEYLNRLIVLDNEITHKQQRLETLRDVAINTSPEYGGDAVQRTREKNPLENIMAKIIDLDREIDADIDALVDLKAEVWEKLDKLKDEIQKRILWLHYSERLSWTKVAAEMNFTTRYVYIIHRAALDELDKILKQDSGISVTVQ